MGLTLSRSIGDTEPMDYIIEEKPFGTDITGPVDLEDKEVLITVYDGEDREYTVESAYVFVDEAARDAYFVANPGELIDGLLIEVDGEKLRYVGNEWSTSTKFIVHNKPCVVSSTVDGKITYNWTTEEVKTAGMYHVFFRVITTVEGEGGNPDTVTEARYPKSVSLWIHIIDVFDE